MRQPRSKRNSMSDELAFELFYSNLREPKKKGGINYGPGSEDRIVNSLQIMGIKVNDFQIDVADYQNYFAAARYSKDYTSYYPFNI